MPDFDFYTNSDAGIQLNSYLIDATWVYNPVADFPATGNPFSIVNSALALLPTWPADFLSGDFTEIFQKTFTTAVTEFGTFDLSGEAGSGSAAQALTDIIQGATGFIKEFYINPPVAADLPLLSPMRLPATLVNTVLGALGSPYLLGTPLADALQPAMKILVNIGYTDVVTPQDIAADPSKYGGYQPYDRTLFGGNVPTPFGSVDPLTPEEQAEVQGDVFDALVSGFQTQLQKPLWGLIVPNPATNAPAATAASKPRVVAPAAALETSPASVEAIEVTPELERGVEADPVVQQPNPTASRPTVKLPTRSSAAVAAASAAAEPGTSAPAPKKAGSAKASTGRNR